MKPAMTMFRATVSILLDPRFCNLSEAGASDWISETFRNLEEHGLVDWGYVFTPSPILVPSEYEEGDFLNPSRLAEDE